MRNTHRDCKKASDVETNGGVKCTDTFKPEREIITPEADSLLGACEQSRLEGNETNECTDNMCDVYTNSIYVMSLMQDTMC
jgi:hypothetical protein